MGDNLYHVGYGFWGMLSAWGVRSMVANSFERYRLGWINVNEVNSSPNQTISNATISDYVITGVSYRLNINPGSHEYFYIENHQKQSYWENPHAFGTYGSFNVFGTVEKGLYVLRQSGFIGSKVQMIPADGRFSWTVNQLIQNPWGAGHLPVFKITVIDRVNGYHDVQYIPWTWGGVNKPAEPIHFMENENGQPILDIRHLGNGKDAFRIGYNEVFSQWSNPNSQRENKTSTPFGFKVNNLVNGVYSIDIYVNTSINAPPSKPQDLSLTVHNTGDNAFPKLNWELNLEPDVIASSQGYLIERSLYGGAFTQIATVNGTTSQYIDFGVPWAGGGPNNAAYKIRAKDTQSLTSLYSEIKSIQYGNAWKSGSHKDETFVVTEYNLNQNFPNPFNPQTTIQYDVKEKGFVQLKVYDMLGNEVAVLVNELKEHGRYNININANSLSSGVYIYSIKVNDFIQHRKMTLIK